MVKVNNKATRTTPCCSVFIVNLEQVNASWEDVNGFKSTGRVSLFFVLTLKKGQETAVRVKIISYLVRQ